MAVELILTTVAAQLDLTLLRDENPIANEATRSAFDQLELPTGHAAMVRSLVTQHFRARQSASRTKQAMSSGDPQTDLIRGKGE